MGGRILVIRGGAIGDFILTLPVLAALRQAFPAAHLAVLGYRRVAGLAVEAGLADEAHPIEARGLALFFGPGGALPEPWTWFFRSYDLTVSYLYDPDRLFENNVRRCGRGQYLAGPHRPDDAGSRHATEVLLEPLKALAIFDADPVPRLSLPAQNPGPAPGAAPCGPAGVPGGSCLAVHPGSGSEKKNWPEARWAELLRLLAPRPDLGLLLAGGEAETDRLDRLEREWPRERLVTAYNWGLVELARRLARCTAFVGHDSGITHLAAALGVPTLALWGVTREEVWGPRGRSVEVLRAPRGLNALTAAEVQGRLGGLLLS